MSKNLILMLVTLLAISCSNTNPKSNLSEYDQKVIQFVELKHIEQEKILSDSSIFLDIKLQCTEKEYRSKIQDLVNENKLIKNYTNYIYVFEFMDGAVIAHGKLEPYFHNNRLYKLKIKCEVQNNVIAGNASYLFNQFDSLLSEKYSTYESALIIEPSAYIYRRGWFGDGKIIELDNDVITYSCASAEKEVEDIEEASRKVEDNKIKSDL